MGGKEGGRGYLYQGIVAVLEALRRNNWDRIYIEFPTEGDKVDIALKSADTITDAIQVKSTVNSFSKGDISKWLKDIITDYPCQRYCLVLIGNCAVSAVDFMNAITKFQTGKLDATGKKQLEKFETQLLKDINVDFKVLPFDCSATSFLRNWDSILEKKRANLRSISEPARLRQPPPPEARERHTQEGGIKAYGRSDE